MAPALVVFAPGKATALAAMRKFPTHVAMLRNVRSTTKISVGAPISSESNQGCVETCAMTRACVSSPITHPKTSKWLVTSPKSLNVFQTHTNLNCPNLANMGPPPTSENSVHGKFNF